MQHAFTDDGVAINSELINGLPTEEAKQRIIEALEIENTGRRTIKYKLRDWLFSRQRYWGEPFPILLDAEGNPYAVDESELPLTLPEMADFKPTGTPEPPLSKAKDWLTVRRDGRSFTRETNTMPQWAGSCWYYLRYIDPTNPDRFVDPEKERYWMPVDLYVGGVEHAVLHLLYARFWHKVLYDLGHVVDGGAVRPAREPGAHPRRDGVPRVLTEDGTLVTASDAKDLNEEATEDGTRLIATHAKTGAKLIGKRLSEEEVEKTANGFRLRSNPNVRVDARSFKMSKSRGQRRQPRRHREGLRRRHVPPLRDVHGPAGGPEAVEHARHRRHVAVPQRRLAEPGRRRGVGQDGRNRRRRRSPKRSTGRCTGRSRRSPRTCRRCGSTRPSRS